LRWLDSPEAKAGAGSKKHKITGSKKKNIFSFQENY